MRSTQLIDDDNADTSAVSAFLDDARSIACGIDAELCGILGADCATSTPSARWNGRRAEGLSLCLNMLRYVQPEAGETHEIARVDRGISYILRELSKLAAPSLQPSVRDLHSA